MGESDIVYLGNVNAIKHGILATTAEVLRGSLQLQVCTIFWGLPFFQVGS